MNLEEYKGVFVFAQQVDNELTPIAFELIGKGKDLAKDLNTDVTAVLIGSDVKSLADELAEYGADKVIVVDDPELKDYRTEPYAHALASVIKEYKPEIMLVGATAIGRDLGPRVSARVQTGLTADCTLLEIGDFPLNPMPGKEQKHNQLLMTRPAFGGNTIATIACPDNRPQMATVRPGVMQKIDPIEGAKAEVIEYNPGFTPDNKYVEIMDIVKSVTDTVDIMDAKILVSGGRGVGEEGFGMLKELAEVLGGEVSCSRAVVDNGWQPRDIQVGQTGKTVRPNVYFAIGISGAIQHVAGMEESDIIIAINKDETAPIFDVADYGIVGDLNKILPALTEKIKEAKKKLHTSEQEHEEDEDNEYEEEIMNIVNEGHEQGAIMEGEARMITNIFEFGDKDVTDVMTSRKKIDAIDVNMSVEKALNYMLDEPYSRYPLYEDDIDNIVGVLYLKDVIDAYLNQKEATLSDIAREPFFVHQTMNLSVLFQEMQTKKIHMAIVIDEYSQTEGIVSMEDMLEVIVGNILDEYDVEDRNITKIGWADIYLVRGSTRLEELEDTLGIEFDVEDIETLNGFLIDQLGHLPEDNEEIEIIYQGYSFKSVDIHDNMIRQVKVEKRKRKEEEDVRTQ